MKLIAHRGNINGPDSLMENNPEYIENAISQGYDVEIDIRCDDITKEFYLGHDEPKYMVDWLWLSKHREKLWIHCKNIEALYEFSSGSSGYNYFWHQTDSYTMTSQGYIWSYPGKRYNSRSIVVMPEHNDMLPFMQDNHIDMKDHDCFGICSDYVEKIK